MQVIRYHSDHGHVICLLAKVGRKFISLIPMDARGIRVKRVPLAEKRYFKELDYSIPKAKKQFRASARKFGVTKEAQLYLRGK